MPQNRHSSDWIDQMTVLTVSQLNNYIKCVLDEDPHLRTVYLKGEISNFKNHYSSGHLYLSLKDDKSAVKAVMFSSAASRLRFRPEDGMCVIARGYVSVYPQGGQYQLYIQDMQPDGVGALALAFEQLKKKLEAEGLFDASFKKPLPTLPRRIGVITSPTGAAVMDITRILARRYPMAEVVLCPVLVQGDGAAAQLTDAIRRFDRRNDIDVIIIGRGGGSIEDLWAFNDEGLARAIFDCHIPVVSGVGHETDFTICDFVADVRASTPSAAAECVSPEQGELLSAVDYYRDTIISLMRARLDRERTQLDRLLSSRTLRSPMEIVNVKRMQLDHMESRMNSAYSMHVKNKKEDFNSLAAKLDALSPLRVLSRGYAAASKDGKCISSVSDAETGDRIEIRLSDGSLGCLVERKIKTDEKGGL